MEILVQTLGAFRVGNDLDCEFAAPFFDALITEADEDLLAELLTAWNGKGITGEEVFSLASIMRDRMKRIRTDHSKFIDAVGTGGSQAKTFNVSTAAAFVIAGAGVPVAKHGNRAASSRSGSADVLTELGVRVDVEPETAQRCLNEIGICFMYAPRFHSLSPTLTAARRCVGKPTIFNCLGPLCNPASAPHQVIGVWNRELAKTMAEALGRMGTKRSWVVHGEDGLDELTVSGRTFVYEVCCENVRDLEVTPADFGSRLFDPDSVIRTSNAAESASVVEKLLKNELRDSASEDLVLINAAAGIYVAGASASLTEAFEMAMQSVRSSDALSKLEMLRSLTNQ
jgi:anthranilate phosphoribosyltransferase